MYLVVSHEMANDARFFGYLPAGALDTLMSTLDSAVQWTVLYRSPDVTIYRYRH